MTIAHQTDTSTPQMSARDRTILIIALSTIVPLAFLSVLYRIIASTNGSVAPFLTGVAAAVIATGVIASKGIGARIASGAIATSLAFSAYAGTNDRSIIADRGSLETGCFDAALETVGVDLYKNSRGSCRPRAFNS